MQKHRMSLEDFLCLGLLLCIPARQLAVAQENFEDADKLSDLMSSSNQNFDLRHTIPGEPEIDYPIYSTVPETSFECNGRHEGYYADIESRCQAFRICTHTARSISGFGFLCPNGTLFSQKYFVCDWYRNVNCDESEQYYSKNDANRIHVADMMETVRQMMEYPMKTISKALEQSAGVSSNRRPAHRQQNISSNEIAKAASVGGGNEEQPLAGGRRPGGSRKSAVTRAQVESAQGLNNGRRGNAHRRNQKKDFDDHAAKNERRLTKDNDSNREHPDGVAVTKHIEEHKVVEAAESAVKDDVYVNSLGELSTDPDVQFDRTNAHIIAEPRHRTYQYDKKMNFAEKVNAGLNDLAELPSNDVLAPDYVKSMRSTKDEATKVDLASNINGLLDEIANDLDPSQSGYQVQAPKKVKHSIRLLSRGFSSQSDLYKYDKPKQTASTVRFTPNELPIDPKDLKHNFDIAEEGLPFGFAMTTTPEAPALEDSYLTAPTLPAQNEGLDPAPAVPLSDDLSFLAPPIFEPGSGPQESFSANYSQEFIINAADTTLPPTEQEPVTAALTQDAADAPTYAALIDTTTIAIETSSTDSKETTTPPAKDIKDNLIATQATEDTEPSTEPPKLEAVKNDTVIVDEEKADVNNYAEGLLLSGLKLTSNVNSTENEPITASNHLPVIDNPASIIAWVTSTERATVSGTTAAAAEATNTENGYGNSVQERLRNYRRFATLQRATAKPLIYTKRAASRTTPKSYTANTTTTKPLTTSTRSYLKRVAASRLRLSRLAAAANGNKSASNSLSPVDHVSPSAEGKRVSARNIDKETGNLSNGIAQGKAGADVGAVTWESVRNNLQRYQVKGNKRTEDNLGKNYNAETSTSKSAPTTTAIGSSSHNSALRSRHRFSSIKGNSNGRGASLSLSRTTTSKVATVMPTVTTASPHHKSNTVDGGSLSSSSASPSYASAATLEFLNSISSSVLASTQTNSQASGAPLLSSTSIASSSPSAAAAPSSLSSSLVSSLKSHASDPNTKSPTIPNTNTYANTNTNIAPTQLPSLAQTPTYISFDKLTQSIIDDSKLQSFQEKHAGSRSQSVRPAYQQIHTAPLPVQSSTFSKSNSEASSLSKVHALALSHLLPPPPPPQVQAHKKPQTIQHGPNIVIARAEGQRIEPNSVSSIISSLISQQQQNQQSKPAPASTYVPLNDFLSRKFSATAPASQQHQKLQQQTNYQQPLQIVTPLQQQQQQQQQQHSYQTQLLASVQPQQHSTTSQQQRYQQPQLSSSYQTLSSQFSSPQKPVSHSSVYYPQMHNSQSTFSFQGLAASGPGIGSSIAGPASSSSGIQPFVPQNIISGLQQQQQSLPHFPPLGQSPVASSQLQASAIGGTKYFNVPLPSLGSGLIPAPVAAQRRSDDDAEEIEFIPIRQSSRRPYAKALSSYDVPLNSVGRLSNDIAATFRRFLRK